MGKSAGKKDLKPPKVTYPQGGENIPPNWKAEWLAEDLHDVMDGGSDSEFTKDEKWMQLRDLPTDEMVIAVYDVFNQVYIKEGNGTLTQWIDDEINYDWFSGVKSSTLERLKKLGLR